MKNSTYTTDGSVGRLLDDAYRKLDLRTWENCRSDRVAEAVREVTSERQSYLVASDVEAPRSSSPAFASSLMALR